MDRRRPWTQCSFECVHHSSDPEVFAFVREHLYVATVCGILDSLGRRRQGMHQRLRPLLPDPAACGFVGRARTIRWMDMDSVVEDDPYGLEIEGMDSLRPGDVAHGAVRCFGRLAAAFRMACQISSIRLSLDR